MPDEPLDLDELERLHRGATPAPWGEDEPLGTHIVSHHPEVIDPYSGQPRDLFEVLRRCPGALDGGVIGVQAAAALLIGRLYADAYERISLDDLIRECGLSRAELESELDAEIASGLHPIEGDPGY